MFNPKRLDLAQKRRRYTSRILAERSGISTITLSRILNGKQDPEQDTIDRLVRALGFPHDFFFKDDPAIIPVEAASFRSLTAMSAKERNATLNAGSLALEFLDYIKDMFALPEPDLLELGPRHLQEPAATARMLRNYWSIGEKPVGNLIKLLETKGVRVFSLAENTKNVDAFSMWRDDEPFVFLNTLKSSEHSRFDAAHELGHLILHRHGGPKGRDAENEANQFASAFLMPKADVISQIPYVSSVRQVVKAKARWGVSAVALAYRLNKLGLLTEWQYIQLNRQYRSREPNPMPREYSSVWDMVLKELWKEGHTREHIAAKLSIPTSELDNLIFGLTGSVLKPERSKPELKLV